MLTEVFKDRSGPSFPTLALVNPTHASPQWAPSRVPGHLPTQQEWIMSEASLWKSVPDWSNLSFTPIEDCAMFQPRSLERAGFDPDELGATALTAFFNITAAW